MFSKLTHWLESRANREKVNFLKHRANDEIRTEKYAEAAKTLAEILSLDDQETDAQLNLPKVLARAGENVEALAELKKALSQNASWAASLQMTAVKIMEALEKDGKGKEMRDATYELINAHPDLLELRVFLAQRLFLNGTAQEAESELMAVIALDPEHLEAMVGMCHCHIAQGRKTEALVLIEKIAKQNKPRADELLSATYENVQNFS